VESSNGGISYALDKICHRIFLRRRGRCLHAVFYCSVLHVKLFVVLLAAGALVALYLGVRGASPVPSKPESNELTADRSSSAAKAQGTNSTSGLSGSQRDSVASSTSASRATVAGTTHMTRGALVERLIARASSARTALAATNELDPAAKAYAYALVGESCSNDRRTQPSFGYVVDGANERRASAKRTIDVRHPAAFCADVVALDKVALDAAWSDAAKLGDPRAKAHLWWREWETTFPVTHTSATDKDEVRTPRKWDEQGVGKLVEAMATGDPAAIDSFGRRLQATAEENAITLANGGEWLAELPYHTWELLGCGFGGRCTADDSPTMLHGCVTRGQCEASTLDEYLRKYVWSGAEAAMYDAVAERLRQLIQTGNPQLLLIRPRTDGGKPLSTSVPYPFRYR
jgi:hypothetical protein